jgi:hypothetical protein
MNYEFSLYLINIDTEPNECQSFIQVNECLLPVPFIKLSPYRITYAIKFIHLRFQMSNLKFEIMHPK